MKDCLNRLNECKLAAERIKYSVSLLNEAVADANSLGMYILIDKEIRVHETDKAPPTTPLKYVLVKATYPIDFSE